MSCACVLSHDGDIREIHLPGESPGNLAIMRREIGCSRVEVVQLTSQMDMWIDEEGLYTQPFNWPATMLARRYGFVWQPYHGPVILSGVTEDGRTVNLKRAQMVGLLLSLDDIATS